VVDDSTIKRSEQLICRANAPKLFLPQRNGVTENFTRLCLVKAGEMNQKLFFSVSLRQFIPDLLFGPFALIDLMAYTFYQKNF
jgi:hypothetical protein